MPVYRQLNESFNHALTRSVRGDISPETLVVCQMKGISTVEGGNDQKDIFNQLGAFFASFVNKSGLLLLWQQHDESNLTPTDLVFELANSGLIPASGGNTPLHFFGPDTQFAAYFQKQPFLFRYPRCEDLERLCTIDKELWDEELLYPHDVLEEWLNSKPQNIIVLVDGSSGDIVGAIYSQRVKDGEAMDLMPWRESITETVRIREHSKNSNIDPNGMVKQLMRVSTQKGGAGVGTSATGIVLRDFALIVAASQRIGHVVSVY